jgi:hypothetical protein
LYVFIKWLQRRLFIRQLRMDRITVAELRKLIDDGQTLLILDVRPKEIRENDGIIAGALGAPHGHRSPYNELPTRGGDCDVLRMSE